MLDMHLTAPGPGRAETRVNGVTMKTTVLAVLALAAFATAQQVPDPKAELAKVIAVEEQEGDLEKAEGMYRQALAGTELSAPGRALATLRLGLLLQKLGRDAEAKPLLEEAKKSAGVVVSLDDVTDAQRIAREKELREQARAIVRRTLEQKGYNSSVPLPGFADPADATRLLWIGAPAVPEVITALQERRGAELDLYLGWGVSGLAGFLWGAGDDASAAFLTSCADGGTLSFRTAIVRNAGLAKSQRMLDVAAKFLRDPDPSGDVVRVLLDYPFDLASRLDPDRVADAGSEGSLPATQAVLAWARRQPRLLGREALARLHRRVALLLEGTDPQLGLQLQLFLGTLTSQRSCEGVCMLLTELPKMVEPRFDVFPGEHDFGFTSEEQATLRPKIDACLAAFEGKGQRELGVGLTYPFMMAATRDAAPDVVPALMRWLEAGQLEMLGRLAEQPSLPAEMCERLLAVAAAVDPQQGWTLRLSQAMRLTGNPQGAAWLLARYRAGYAEAGEQLIALARTCQEEPVRAALRDLVEKDHDATALSVLLDLGDAKALELAPTMPDSKDAKWLSRLLEEPNERVTKFTDEQIHGLLARLDDGNHNALLAYEKFLVHNVPDRHVLALARLGRWIDVVCGRLAADDVDAPRKAAIRAFCHEALRGAEPTRKAEILQNLPETEFAEFRAETEALLDDAEDWVAQAAAYFVLNSGQLTQREWRHRLLTNRHALVRGVAFRNTDATHCTREDLPDLLACLSNPDEDIRLRAAIVCGNNLWVEAVPNLLALLSDQDVVVRKQATEALERIRFYADQQAHWDRVLKGLDATPASAAEKLLLQAKPDQPKDQRLLALQSLGVLGVPEALPFLIDWSRDTDPAIQQAAKDAITQIHLHPRR